MTTSTPIRSELDRARVTYDVIGHRRTESAGEEADAVGVLPADVAKTLVLASGSGYVRAVLPASEHLDLRKVRQYLGDGHARLLSERELVFAYPMYELGAVPPFGTPAGDEVLVDRRLAEHESVVLEAGSHTESVRMRISDLLAISGARVVDITANEALASGRV